MSVKRRRAQLSKWRVAADFLQVQGTKVFLIEGELHDVLVDVSLQVAAVTVADELPAPHV